MEIKNQFAPLYRSAGWTAAVFVLTAFHHYYGSLVYGTPWRAHVVSGGGVVLLLCFLLGGLYRRYQKKPLLYTYLAIASVMFGVLIGVFEGFYNHTVKDLLYFLGMNRNDWRLLFPSPAYEIPDNLVFESTGIAQFPIGIVQLYALYRVYRAGIDKSY